MNNNILAYATFPASFKNIRYNANFPSRATFLSIPKRYVLSVSYRYKAFSRISRISDNFNSALSCNFAKLDTITLVENIR
ncbi:MAG: hypothetical protein RR086_01670 [Clostridia bacterium]